MGALGALRQIAQTSSGLGHRASYFGVLPASRGLPAIRMVVHPLHSLAFALRSRSLTLVRTRLSLVCVLFTGVCDPVPLVSDPISFVGDPLAPQ